MIKEIKIYTLICDSCGKDVCDNSEFSGWDEINYLRDIADNEDWANENDREYCSKCHTVDDNDNLIIKPKL